MAVLPNSRSKMLAFFEQRLNHWQMNAEALHLSPSELDGLQQRISAARQSLADHRLAQNQARGAAVVYHANADELRRYGSKLVQMMRTLAELENDADIYEMSLLPEPSKPSPRPAPPAPRGVEATQRSDGSVELQWKGRFGEGAFFAIRRTLRDTEGRSGLPQFIGTTAARRFIDETVPLYTLAAYYEVQAQRGEKKSPWSSSAVIRTAGEKSTGATAPNGIAA